MTILDETFAMFISIIIDENDPSSGYDNIGNILSAQLIKAQSNVEKRAKMTFAGRDSRRVVKF